MITPQLSFLYTLMIIGVIIGYMVVTDRNVAEYIILKLQLIRINIIRRYLLIKIGTQLKIDRWKMQRWMEKDFPRLKEQQEQQQQQEAFINE